MRWAYIFALCQCIHVHASCEHLLFTAPNQFWGGSQATSIATACPERHSCPQQLTCVVPAWVTVISSAALHKRNVSYLVLASVQQGATHRACRLKLCARAQARKWVWAALNGNKRIEKWVGIMQSLSHTELGFQLLCKTALSLKVCSQNRIHVAASMHNRAHGQALRASGDT